MRSVIATAKPARRSGHERSSATRVVASVFGVVAALAGIEHGIGELRQGRVPPDGLVIESWPDSQAFEILGGEPAMTVVPDLLVTGILAVIVSIALGTWAAGFVRRRDGGLVLILLSVALLLVGGGFGPPLIGVIVGIAATRIGIASRRPPGRLARGLARLWPWPVAAGVAGYLGLVPGTVLLEGFTDVDTSGLVAVLIVAAFAGVLLSIASARARDRLTAVASRTR